MWYFAYGSNLNARAVGEWCKHYGLRCPNMRGGKPGAELWQITDAAPTVLQRQPLDDTNDGEDLRALPLIERKAKLKTLIESAGNGPLLYSDHIEDDADLLRLKAGFLQYFAHAEYIVHAAVQLVGRIGKEKALSDALTADLKAAVVEFKQTYR